MTIECAHDIMCLIREKETASGGAGLREQLKRLTKKTSYVVVFICMSVASFAFASQILTISYPSNWFSGSRFAGYWEDSPYVGFCNLTPSFPGVAYISNAVSTWNSAGIPSQITTSPSNSEIDYYVGTASQLNMYGFAYNSTVDGQTTFGTYDRELVAGTQTGYYNDIEIYRISGARCSFKTDISGFDPSLLSTVYTSVSIHELGHALGWFDHTPTQGYLMWAQTSTITTLTAAEKNHILEVYSIGEGI